LQSGRTRVTPNRKSSLPHKDQLKAATPTTNEGDDESEAQTSELRPSGSSTALKDLIKAGSHPLKTASDLAGFLRARTKRMGNLLSTDSIGYYEKVSGMWAGGGKHYGTAEGLAPDDDIQNLEDEQDLAKHTERFRAHFALPESELLEAAFYGYFHRVLPLYGKIYIGNKHFCFRSLLPGTRTKLVLPLTDIENATKEPGYRFGYHALVVVIRGHDELFFDFASQDFRDDCAITILQSLNAVKENDTAAVLTRDEAAEAEAAKFEHEILQVARADGHAEHDVKLPCTIAETEPDAPPIFFDDIKASILNFKPTESLRITCLTIGSRGDVQPYIALCKGLLADGHKPRIATHGEFQGWVESHGIEFHKVEGDPADLMRICIENGMFTPSFMREAFSKVCKLERLEQCEG